MAVRGYFAFTRGHGAIAELDGLRAFAIHLTLFPAVRQSLDAAVGLDTLAPATQALIFLPAYALVSIVAALILHYQVEKPFLLLKDRVRSAPDAHPTRIEYAN